jgi:hypothetical protein
MTERERQLEAVLEEILTLRPPPRISNRVKKALGKPLS